MKRKTEQMMDRPICCNCNRQLRPIPKAYKLSLAYRLLRRLQGFPSWSNSDLLCACLEWLVVEGDGSGWQPVPLAWCSCDYAAPGAEGSSFWRGIHVATIFSADLQQSDGSA